MLSPLRALGTSVGVGLALGTIACGHGPGEVAEGKNSGIASITLALVPADVACIQITSQGASRTQLDSFSVAPNQTTVLKLKGLPTGNVAFSGQAFGTSCSSVTSSTIANYIADPVSVAGPDGVQQRRVRLGDRRVRRRLPVPGGIRLGDEAVHARTLGMQRASGRRAGVTIR